MLEEFIETKETLYAREGKDPWRSQPNVGSISAAPVRRPALYRFSTPWSG